jgi:putative transposase
MPMTDSAASELAQLLRSGTAGKLISELVRQGLQALIEAEASAAVGAERHERSDHRRSHRYSNHEKNESVALTAWQGRNLSSAGSVFSRSNYQ